MARKNPTYITQRTENIKVLIATIKARQHLRDEDIAVRIGMPLSTFKARKGNPSTFRLCEVWLLMQLGDVQPEQKHELL